MHLTLEYKCMILTLLTLTTGCCATTNSSWNFTNESTDCARAGVTHRVRIPPFILAFYPTTDLTETQHDVIRESAEEVLLDFFSTKFNDCATVDFVSLLIKRNHTIFRRRQPLDNNTAVLSFSGGTARFRGGVPARGEVNAWASQALEGFLLAMLQEKSELTTVESIVFRSLTAPPTPSPSTPQVIESVSNFESTPNNPTFTLVFAAAVIGGFALVSLVLLAGRPMTC